MLNTVRARLTLAFALLLAMILLLAGFVTYESRMVISVDLDRQREAADMVRYADQLQIDLLDLETGKRGYLLNGRDEFLAPYNTGRRNFERDLAEARRLNVRSGEDLVGPGTLDDLEAEYQEILALFEEQIQARRGETMDPAELRVGEGKDEMDQARESLGRLQDEALASRDAARQSTRIAVRWQTAVAALLGSLALLTAVGSMLYVRRGVVSPLRKLEDGARKVGEGDLEHRIDLRTGDELGEVAAAFNDMLDARREANGALRRSEEGNRAIVETATEAIITMTQDGLIHSFNPAAERIFCYTAEEVLEQSLKILMPERFHEPHEKGFQRYLGGGEARVIGKGAVELAGMRKGGEEFPLELSLGEMREEGGILFTGIIRDITERKQGEEKLSRSESQFRQLFEQSVDALIVHDEQGRIVDCNEEMARSLGYSREEMLNLRVRDFATGLISREKASPEGNGTLWQRAVGGRRVRCRACIWESIGARTARASRWRCA